MKNISKKIVLLFFGVLLFITACKVEPLKQQDVIPESYLGYFEEYINVKDFVVIQNEYVKLFIAKDIAYSRDIEKTTMEAVKWVEEFSGYQMLTRRKNINVDTYYSLEQLAEMSQDLRYLNLFNEITYFDNKIIIYSNKYGYTYAFENSIAFSEELWVIDTYDSYEFGALLHEFLHVTQARIASNAGFCYPFVEGYSVWGSRKIAEAKGLKNLCEIYKQQFVDNFPVKDASVIPGKGFESYFANDYLFDEKIDNSYYFGFAFCLYLEETYGLEIFKEIFAAGEGMYSFTINDDQAQDDDRLFNGLHYVAAIKSVTSQQVFSDFETWFLEYLIEVSLFD